MSLAWVGEPQVGSYANTDVGAVAVSGTGASGTVTLTATF